MGRAEARLRLHQVLHIHARGVALHATGHIRPVLRGGGGPGLLHLRHGGHRHRLRRFRHHVPNTGVRPALLRLHSEDAHGAVPYLVARRPRRGPHRWVGPSGRSAAEDGLVRYHPDRHADPARRLEPRVRCPGEQRFPGIKRLADRHDRARRPVHALRRGDVHRAEGHQEDGGLFLHQPHGRCPAGLRHLHGDRSGGRRVHDVRPRSDHGGPLHDGRCDPAQDRHQDDPAAGRTGRKDARRPRCS